MANEHLQLRPKKVYDVPGEPCRDDAWWYEDVRGIDVMHEVRSPDGSYLRTDRLHIPWSRLRGAIQRKDAPPVFAERNTREPTR